MKLYKRIIFIGRSGNLREPMAVAIARDCCLSEEIELYARGLVVAFPEPMNQKAEAVLISNGIEVEGFQSVQISEEDITEDTLILAMEADHKNRIRRMYPNLLPDQLYVLTEFVGDELEIIDPYGGSLTAYGLCYESMRKTIQKLIKIVGGGE